MQSTEYDAGNNSVPTEMLTKEAPSDQKELIDVEGPFLQDAEGGLESLPEEPDANPTEDPKEVAPEDIPEATTSETTAEQEQPVPEKTVIPKTVWVAQAGNQGHEVGWAVATDRDGNIYVTGAFGSVATFGSFTLTSAGAFDVFVAKLDAQGVFLWVRQMAGSNSDDRAIAMDVDSTGNVYVAGIFQSTTLDVGTYKLSNSGKDDIFVAKWDTHGNLQWAVRAGGPETDEVLRLRLDRQENPWISGSFDSQTIAFGSTTLQKMGLNGLNGLNGYIVKLNPQGQFIWAKGFAGSKRNDVVSFDFDASANLYIGGYFQGSKPFGTTTIHASGDSDGYVAKYNEQGTLQWYRVFASSSADEVADLRVRNEQVFVTGMFGGSLTLGTTAMTNAGGSFDVFVTSLNAKDGTVQSASHIESSDTTFVRGIAFDSKGYSYVVGHYKGNSITAGNHRSSPPIPGGYTGFLAQLHPQGSFLWLQSFGGSLDDFAYGHTTGSTGAVFVTGSFRDIANFGSTQLSSKGDGDLFIWKVQ